MGSTGWIILAAVNIPVYFGLGKLIFKTWENFWASIKFWLTPELFSLFRGEYWDDCLAELKLGFWIVACGLCVFVEGMLIDKIIN
jgi:hypothetical protein